jgi:hypothetical protein
MSQEQKVQPNSRLYLLSLDFITTEFSQTKLNRFFWLISDYPESVEEPKINYHFTSE